MRPDEQVDQFAHRLTKYHELMEKHGVVFNLKETFLQGLSENLRGQMMNSHRADIGNPATTIKDLAKWACELETEARKYHTQDPIAQLMQGLARLGVTFGNPPGVTALPGSNLVAAPAGLPPSMQPVVSAPTQGLPSFSSTPVHGHTQPVSVQHPMQAPMQASMLAPMQAMAATGQYRFYCDKHGPNTSHNTEDCVFSGGLERKVQAMLDKHTEKMEELVEAARKESHHAATATAAASSHPAIKPKGYPDRPQGSRPQGGRYNRGPPPPLEEVQCRRCWQYGHFASRCEAPKPVPRDYARDKPRTEHKVSALQYSPQDARPIEMNGQLYVPVMSAKPTGSPPASSSGSQPYVVFQEAVPQVRSAVLVLEEQAGASSLAMRAPRSSVVPHSFLRKEQASGSRNAASASASAEPEGGVSKEAFALARDYALRSKAKGGEREGAMDTPKAGAGPQPHASLNGAAYQAMAKQLRQVFEKYVPPAQVMDCTVEACLAVGSFIQASTGAAEPKANAARASAAELAPLSEDLEEIEAEHEPSSSVMRLSTDPAGYLPGVPPCGDPPAEWFSSKVARDAHAARPGLAFLVNKSPATGITLTHPAATPEQNKLPLETLVDPGSNVAMVTYSGAARKGLPLREIDATLFPAVGGRASIKHCVDDVCVVYAQGTPNERKVSGLLTLVTESISNTNAEFLLPENAQKEACAFVDPHMHVLRYKPRYGVNGSTDPTLCNMPVRFRYLSAQAPDHSEPAAGMSA